MNILFTGASSFTGFWFAKMLSQKGHHVLAPLQSAVPSYQEGPRAERVKHLSDHVEIVENCSFGSSRFMDCLKGNDFDILCHHAAHVSDYRSPDFNITGAVQENTHNLRQILLSEKIGALILTGSVFEQNEGVGEAPLRAFSPYGLSKGLTTDIVRYRCQEINIPFGKFVIPNPFGVYEEPRFCAYLMRTWKAGKLAGVNTPAYIRDNIHVDLLALAYAQYADDVSTGSAPEKLNPSGYVEMQGVFAERFAREMRKRLDLECALNLAHQTEFLEPVMRVNVDPAGQYVTGWDETKAWDGIADYYSCLG